MTIIKTTLDELPLRHPKDLLDTDLINLQQRKFLEDKTLNWIILVEHESNNFILAYTCIITNDEDLSRLHLLFPDPTIT